jgi:hypothetical protein
MKAEVGRRAFVGSVVAGLPFVAGHAALAQREEIVRHAHAAGDTDPVLDLLVRQIAGVHNAAQTAPRSEHFRALAAQLRTMAVYERQLDVDNQVRTALRALVERDGRNAILYAEPDVQKQRQNLQAYGFRVPGRGREVPLYPTHQQREATLDALLEGGITPAFESMAATADRVARRVDASRTPTIASQSDRDWWIGFCTQLFAEYQKAQLMAAPVCLIADYFSYLVPSCAALEGGAMALLLAYFVECYLFN